MRISRSIVLLASLASVALSAVSTSAASAAPVWRFNGNELVGEEKVKGAAIDGSLTVPGATTTCERIGLTMKISNAGGVGKGEVTKLPLTGCHTPEGSPCIVESIAAGKTTVVGAHDEECRQRLRDNRKHAHRHHVRRSAMRAFRRAHHRHRHSRGFVRKCDLHFDLQRHELQSDGHLAESRDYRHRLGCLVCSASHRCALGRSAGALLAGQRARRVGGRTSAARTISRPPR